MKNIIKSVGFEHEFQNQVDRSVCDGGDDVNIAI